MHFLILYTSFTHPSYVYLNPHLRRGDVTASFTLIFTRSPQVYLCTRLVSNVTTPVGWICTQSQITGRASLGGNYLTGWTSSRPLYKRKGKTCATNIPTSESGINPIVVVPSTNLSINLLNSFLRPPFRLLKCQTHPPRELHGN